MKRCPTCQKEFPDSMRFCQTDGTPLVDAVETAVPETPKPISPPPPFNPPSNVQDDPMKTMVVSSDSKEEDILQIPEVFDPMKTMVVSDEVKKSVPPSNPISEPVVSAPDPPKFSEPSLSPPSFGDLSGSSNQPPKFDAPKPIDPPKPIEPAKMDSPFSSPFNEPPQSNTPFSPFNEPPKVDTPVSSPFNEPPKFDAKPLPSDNSPFNQPANSPMSSPFDSPPPFKEPTFANTPPPFDNSPFNQPQTPFGQQSNEQFNPPVQQQSEWTPPAAPVAGWGDQGLGQNTPFTPPPIGSGSQNQTLGIVSLVLGILGFLCLGFIAGVPALITGFMTIKNVNRDPVQYGGKVLAIVGMIFGALGTLWSLAYVAFVIIAILSNAR
jgi:Domain of unknown function (DUF4190)